MATGGGGRGGGTGKGGGCGVSTARQGQKRPADDSPATGREKRRTKFQVQRNIEVQSAPSAGAVVDIEAFAESRALEIKAMEDALDRAAKGGYHRTFQTLPRHMRRRAASHNVKRLPRRYRERALREDEYTAPDKSKPSRKKRRRPGTIVQEYLRRQVKKRWLETHIWHAKRMHMVEMWGYRLGKSPNEKSARATYRACQHVCIAHDASYFGVTEVVGAEEHIVKLLDEHTDPSLPSIGSIRYINGKRAFTTYLYGHLEYPLAGIAPVTVLWRPHINGEETSARLRSFWIWTHASAHPTVIAALRNGAVALGFHELKITDLQTELLMFELSGPKSHYILQSVLMPSKDTGCPTINKSSHETWKKLRHLRSTASLPPGTVLGLTVDDPRLTFPQKVDWHPAPPTPSESEILFQVLQNWPDDVADSAIWDEKVRKETMDKRPAEKELNERRSRNLIPGTKLVPTKADVHVPVLLIQRNAVPERSDKIRNRAEIANGWTLVVPKGWGVPFWKSLVFGGARVGGLVERRQCHFEAGLPCFPYDEPGTRAYDKVIRAESSEAELAYARKPPAKRPNFEMLKVDSPFAAPFADLVRRSTKYAVACMEEQDVEGEREVGQDADSDEEMVEERPGMTKMVCQEADGDKEEIGDERESKAPNEPLEGRPLLFAGSKQDTSSIWRVSDPRILDLLLTTKTDEDTREDLRAVEALSTERLTNLAVSRGLVFAHTAISAGDLCRAIVRVRVTLLGRGVPGAHGILYLASADDYGEWTRRLEVKKNRRTSYEINEMDKIPGNDRIIGYLTSAQFSFTQGCGHALGCCSVVGIRRMVALEQREQRRIKRFVLVRGIQGRIVRPAQIEIIT